MRRHDLLCAVFLHISLLCSLSNCLIVEPQGHYEEEPYHEKYYQYGYQVDDHYTGDYHGHMEHTAGHLTKGEYKVKLPDGRVQVVSYEADHAGFRPRVTYEGISVAGDFLPWLTLQLTEGLYLFTEPPPAHHAQYAPRHHEVVPSTHYQPPPPPPPPPPQYEDSVVKIPFQKPEEMFALAHMEILPTPLPKHKHVKHVKQKHVTTPRPHKTFQLVTPATQPPHHQPFQVVTPRPDSHHQQLPPHMVFTEVEEVHHPVLQASTPASISLFPELTEIVHQPAVEHSQSSFTQETPFTIHHIDESPLTFQHTDVLHPHDSHLGSIQQTPVTVAPSLFTPRPRSPQVAQRRITVSPSPSPLPRRRMPTPYSEMVSLSYNTPLHITPTYHHVTTPSPPSPPPPPPQPSLPPLHYSPEPVLTHKADPSPPTYLDYSQQSPQEEEEEPRFILQLVPNPKYKSSQPSLTTTRTTRRPRVNRTAPLRRNDPGLYPYLYLMSSYLPQTQHSLVVAKKS